MWDVYKKGFRAYLQLEKSLSENSVEAYLHDIDKFTQFLSTGHREMTPKDVELHHMEAFLQWISKLGMTPSSQSRIISGLRNFYKFCLQEQISKTEDRKSTRLNSSHRALSRMPSSA